MATRAKRRMSVCFVPKADIRAEHSGGTPIDAPATFAVQLLPCVGLDRLFNLSLDGVEVKRRRRLHRRIVNGRGRMADSTSVPVTSSVGTGDLLNAGPNKSGCFCPAEFVGTSSDDRRYCPNPASAVSTRASTGVCPNWENMRFASVRCWTASARFFLALYSRPRIICARPM